MIVSTCRLLFVLFVALTLLLTSCASPTVPAAEVQVPDVAGLNTNIPAGFTAVDGSRPLTFPEDFGAHEDFRTEWWYYTGNLQTPEGRHFGFELTIFRVGLVPPTVVLPTDSKWYNHSLYFAHFAISDIPNEHFYAFERYSRPGPGLAGAQADPFRIWLEDWNITEHAPGVYQLQAAQAQVKLDLTLTDEMGVVLQGVNGYSRGGENLSNAAYYYSQPRLRAQGSVQVDGVDYPVSGLAWNDHEFSSGGLDENQIGWDWFSLQFEDGRALMLFQLRERDGSISTASSGTFMVTRGDSKPMQNTDFQITVLDEWRSPHDRQGIYPAAWKIRLNEPDCLLEVHPWMADQEISFPEVTYWEGAVHFEGNCNGAPARGNGYVELTGYAGNLPLR
ncbi:MAG TPA: lipocalin-like domain-containing protein [Anaerolineales bacterium]|nr:lipocalin-like domain-containing protein [Anaerolineales bacterium]